MAKATLAAHRGDRAGTDDAIKEFEAVAKSGTQEFPLCYGLASAFCALLEENRALRIELASMKAPERLQKLATEYGLGPPKPGQIVQVQK